jgi:16S rRNA (guanine527-N7)-methyltransferase
VAEATDVAAVARYAEFFSRPLAGVTADLESYAQLLAKWNAVQNLVSRETLATVWTRHFADSLQLLKLLGVDDGSFVDLGSGGGFPALPLAIASKNSDRSFRLVEPNARKVSFLRTVARQLNLKVVVEGRRADEIDSRETFPDVITSRALAPLVELCRLAAPFFGPKTRALFHKGREHVEELEESAALWQHDVLVLKSDTDAAGVLLEIRNLRLRNK